MQLWLTRTKQAHWANFAELRQDFSGADLVGRLTVFNVGGGNFRLIARVEYRFQRVYVRRILTHAEYDKGDWNNDEWA